MTQIVTAIDELPSSIGHTVVQKDSHGGSVTIASGGDLTIEGSFSGSITIESGGKVTIKGSSRGKVINRGELKIEGKLDGDCDNYGEYELIGRHDGKSLVLKAGSTSIIKGEGEVDLTAEPNSKLEVSPNASLSSSGGNDNEAIVNGGAIAIGGGNVAHSLQSTGSVVFTGNSVFK